MSIRVHIPPLGPTENDIADAIIEEIIREEQLTTKGGYVKLPAGRTRNSYGNVDWGRTK